MLLYKSVSPACINLIEKTITICERKKTVVLHLRPLSILSILADRLLLNCKKKEKSRSERYCLLGQGNTNGRSYYELLHNACLTRVRRSLCVVFFSRTYTFPSEANATTWIKRKQNSPADAGRMMRTIYQSVLLYSDFQYKFHRTNRLETKLISTVKFVFSCKFVAYKIVPNHRSNNEKLNVKKVLRVFSVWNKFWDSWLYFFIIIINIITFGTLNYN